VRDYHPGDALRWVNWRASQRHPGAIYTNEFEQERAANVGLIVDARQSSYFQVGGRSLFDDSIRAVASLADAFLKEGNRVGLMMYGRFIDWTFPGYGKHQRERILHALARARTGESHVFNNLRYLPVRMFPPKSQVILVSPLHKEDVEYLVWLRAIGYSVMVLSPDPLSFEASFMDQDEEAVQLAARVARLERRLFFSQLQQAGIEAISWDSGQPLEGVVRLFSSAQRGRL
jgi:uncharacterized protein (DUF58 family)